MVSCDELHEVFKDNGLTFFTGVPDSTFKEWISFLMDCDGLENIIAVNECEATAIASGYHLATGKTGVVYMQNSGLGKAVNPLTSLCDPEVYSIPLLLMIGWRGEPGRDDEPQHKKMGRIMPALLDTLEIPHSVLPENLPDIKREIARAAEYMEKNKAPYAIIVKRGLLDNLEQKTDKQDFEMTREDAIKAIVDNLQGSEIIVSTTGRTSRELFEYRDEKGKGHHKDFYTVGSMGCSSAIAMAIAMQKSDKRVFVFDGDASVLMQMGTLATMGHYSPKNIFHIVFDNSGHESTGGQPTVSGTVDFDKVASACGYKHVSTVKDREGLTNEINRMLDGEGPQMLVVKVRMGTRKNLGRPTTTPTENKKAFMKHLR